MYYVRLTLLLFVLVITAALFAACGQKGPLYMPDEQQQSDQSEEKS